MNFYLQNSRHSMKSLLNEYKSSLGIQEPIVIDPHVANIVKAVSALTAAFRLVQLDRCKGHRDAACLRELHADKLHEAILANLKKLSFQTMVLLSYISISKTKSIFLHNVEKLNYYEYSHSTLEKLICEIMFLIYITYIIIKILQISNFLKCRK